MPLSSMSINRQQVTCPSLQNPRKMPRKGQCKNRRRRFLPSREWSAWRALVYQRRLFADLTWITPGLLGRGPDTKDIMSKIFQQGKGASESQGKRLTNRLCSRKPYHFSLQTPALSLHVSLSACAREKCRRRRWHNVAWHLS